MSMDSNVSDRSCNEASNCSDISSSQSESNSSTSPSNWPTTQNHTPFKQFPTVLLSNDIHNRDGVDIMKAILTIAKVKGWEHTYKYGMFIKWILDLHNRDFKANSCLNNFQ